MQILMNVRQVDTHVGLNRYATIPEARTPASVLQAIREVETTVWVSHSQT